MVLVNLSYYKYFIFVQLFWKTIPSYFLPISRKCQSPHFVCGICESQTTPFRTMISCKGRFGTWCTLLSPRQYLISPPDSIYSTFTFSCGLPRAITNKIWNLSSIDRSFRNPSLLIDPRMHPPAPFSTAPNRILWQAIPGSQENFCGKCKTISHQKYVTLVWIILVLHNASF